MPKRDDPKERLRENSHQSVEAAERELAGGVAQILQADAVDLETLEPKLSDPVAFSELVRVLQEATAHNVSQSQIVARIKALGDGALRVVRYAAVLLKP